MLRPEAFRFLTINVAALATQRSQISHQPSLMKMRLDVSGSSQKTHWRGGLRKGNRHYKMNAA